MKRYRACDKCHKKYDEEEFQPTSSTKCRPCTVMYEKLLNAFEQMIINPSTGLRKLDIYMDTWYVVSA